jgi:hypothetical protein
LLAVASCTHLRVSGTRVRIVSRHRVLGEDDETTSRSFHHFYADGLKIKHPTGSRIMVDAQWVADDVHHAGGKLDNPPLHA